MPFFFSSTDGVVEADPGTLRDITMDDFERAFNKMKQSKFMSNMSMRFIDVE